METTLELSGKKAKPAKTGNRNVAGTERILSAVGGGVVALYGLRHGRWGGLGLALLGGGLLHRGVSGQCQVYQALGVNTARVKERAGVGSAEGVKVEKNVTINCPPAEVYEFWRKLENLPRFMLHLESVEVLDEKRSRWTAKAPADTKVSWEAEIITDHPNELIAWQSLAGADIRNAGSVHFTSAPGERGTVVRVVLSYEPPAGQLGQWVAKLFGEEPDQQLADDLRRCKQLMEAGETSTIEGQPTGRAATA